jgi:hypothetical protein
MSIEQAVLYCTGANLTFDTLLENYPSAMLNKASSYSFNKSISGVINGNTYTFYPINISNITNNRNTKGIFIFQYNQNINIPQKGILLESHNSWINTTAPLSITLKKPSNLNNTINVQLYILEI